ncbi:MAG: hypothetical protein AAF532_04535 [Planctomycetota bacterium]
MEPRTNPPRPPYRFNLKRFLIWLPGYLVIAGAMYLAIILVLVGPLYWTVYEAYQFGDGNGLVRAYFAPLVIACQYSDTVSGLVDWYVGLWVYEPEWA